MEKVRKEAFVESFKEIAAANRLFVVTQQTALSVGEFDQLRAKVREEQASFRIAKNTLLRLAFKGTPVEDLGEHLTGPTGIAYSEDPVAAARGVAAFVKGNDKAQILAGCLDGKVLDQAGVMALATLPSFDVLRGQVLGVITAPLQKVMGQIQAPGSSLARLLSARVSKG